MIILIVDKQLDSDSENYVALLYMKQEKRESAWSLKNENFISLRLS